MARDLAFVLHSFEMGGAQKRTLALASVLAARGLAVDLVVARSEGPLRATPSPGVRRVELRAMSLSQRDLTLAAAVPALARYIARERPRLVVAAANHAHIAVIAAHALAGRRSGASLALRVSNPLGGSRRRLRDRARRFLFRLLLRRVDGFAAISDEIAGDLIALDPSLASRVVRVANPVAPDQVPDRSEAPQGVLAVGRLAPQKGFDVLLRALATSPSDVVLTILGEGPERPRLEALAGELGLAGRLRMPGEAADPLAAMAQAALTVLPSRYEGLPGVLVEAMACGCPVLASDLPGVREVLGGLGPADGAWRVAPNDPLLLAGALQDALRVEPDTRRLRERAAEFSLEAAAGDFEALLARTVRST